MEPAKGRLIGSLVWQGHQGTRGGGMIQKQDSAWVRCNESWGLAVETEKRRLKEVLESQYHLLEKYLICWSLAFWCLSDEGWFLELKGATQEEGFQEIIWPTLQKLSVATNSIPSISISILTSVPKLSEVWCLKHHSNKEQLGLCSRYYRISFLHSLA